MGQRISFPTLLLLVFVVLGNWRCASAPPFREYSIARTALTSARNMQASRHASGYFHKAEDYYRKGELAYKENDFAVARKLFERAKKYAEKAENLARLKIFQSGEGFP